MKSICSVVLLALFAEALGHGMLLEPVSRSSRWRYDVSAPTNYNDNGLFCGGKTVQWNLNRGICGICGDNFADPKPRANEFGGTYGQGVVVRSYVQGGVMPVTAMITANHKGYFLYSLCNMDIEDETEDCFRPLLTVSGDEKHFLHSDKVGLYNNTIQLPGDVACKHCVVQWTYVTGNSWGNCDNGTSDMGCGPQENFRTCSDISISGTKKSIDDVEEAPEVPSQ